MKSAKQSLADLDAEHAKKREALKAEAESEEQRLEDERKAAELELKLHDKKKAMDALVALDTHGILKIDGEYIVIDCGEKSFSLECVEKFESMGSGWHRRDGKSKVAWSATVTVPL